MTSTTRRLGIALRIVVERKTGEAQARNAAAKRRADLIAQGYDGIVTEAQRCGGIVRSVLRFAREDASEQRPHPIDAVLQRAEELVRSECRRTGVNLELDVARGLPLSVVEVCGDGDHRLGHLLVEVALRRLLHLGQDECADFRWAVFFAR